MQKKLTAVIALASSLTASVASAQEFADRGTLAFSADRLFGLYLTHRELDPDAPFDFEDDDDATELGLLWQAEGLTPFTIPRLSVDYFLIDHLSLGGSLGVTVADNEDDDDPDDSFTGFFIAPRVGGAWMFADWVGIWPRGGFSYYTFDYYDTDISQFALNAEAIFLFKPTDGFAFTIGPAVDVGIAGNYDPPGPSEGDINMYSVGLLSAGILGYINL